MTRWFWSIKDAAQFVLSVAPRAQRGCVYIPKMNSYNLMDVAREISDNIEITGLRCTEKLHEQMISEVESKTSYDQSSWYVIYPSHEPWGESERLGAPVPDGFRLTSQIRDIAEWL